MRTLVAAFMMVLAGCAPAPTPSVPPTSTPAPLSAIEPECYGLPQAEPGVCERMVAGVVATQPDAFRDAVRIVVADTCPPRNLCDRQFFYDAVVLAVPSEMSFADPVAFHVFGHQSQGLSVESWSGALPDHVARHTVRD
jgi:hypothetical protein